MTSTAPGTLGGQWKPLQPDSIVATLRDAHASDQDCLQSVRLIKNEVIGSLSKKALYASQGAIPFLVALAADDSRSEICTQAIAVLGSFAHGVQNEADLVVQSGAVPVLMGKLGHHNAKIVAAALNSLKLICHAIEHVVKAIAKDRSVVSLLVSLLSNNGPIGESAAYLFGKCGEDFTSLDIDLIRSGAEGLFSLLSSPNLKAQEAALEALASLTYQNAFICNALISASVKPNTALVSFLNTLLKDKRSKVRLLTCSILCHLRKLAMKADTSVDPKLLLPTLVKLFADSTIEMRIASPLILAYFIEDNEELQKAVATETDAISKLAEFFKEDSIFSQAEVQAASHGVVTDAVSVFYRVSAQDRLNQAKQKESALVALAAICSKREENRKAVVDAHLVPKLVTALEHPSVNVRAAACQLARSLSRSVKNLRSSLVDAGAAKPLFKLLSDPSIIVQTAASATICNVVLDFSPMKKIVLEQGAVPQLIALTQAEDHELKLNSIWALKNLLYQADSSDKDKVIAFLGWDVLFRLLHDPHSDIQEQALTLVRNLVYGNQSDIEKVMQGFGETLLTTIDEMLAPSTPVKVAVQALYIICNVATGNEQHKTAIMQRESILQNLSNALNHSDFSIRVAAVWCVINLAWSDEPGAASRIHTLRQLGFESRLHSLSEDIELDVRDRVKTALEQFAKHPQ